MFRIDVLQNQWLMLSLIGGTALVLLATLWYVALWRQGDREEGNAAEGGETSRGKAPWVLIVVYVAIALFAAAYVAIRAFYPPNW